jgi:hypothetical protein
MSDRSFKNKFIDKTKEGQFCLGGNGISVNTVEYPVKEMI